MNGFRDRKLSTLAYFVVETLGSGGRGIRVKQRWRAVVPWILLAASMVFMAGAEAAPRSIALNVDGTHVPASAAAEAPYINTDGRNLVSLRHIRQALDGVQVSYDEKTKRAKLTSTTKKIEVPIGQKHLMVDGKKMVMDTVASARNGVTYLPARAIGEALGYKVQWYARTETVYFISAKANNYARYRLVQAKPLPVTVASGGFSATVSKFEIYPIDSAEARNMQKHYELSYFGTPYYLANVHLTLSNESDKSIGFDYQDFTPKFAFLINNDKRVALPATSVKKEYLQALNSPDLLMAWRLEAGKSLTTHAAFVLTQKNIESIDFMVEANSGKASALLAQLGK
ncbi:copper amine oxidase N-terminal domain-containing protein [Paenibacillus methanolicus]|uniref:Copper amine oxidase-like protein n=1 Tax=Paenibacillus methanolicus TaxID=582686 RepID=A0A5S5BS57_9BACL|nr:copper amine oxidase N-terminal domain-containing protein [Paenibacillus methanolicus]TYP69827.1 copper amine oxidase-like protein [Paenibacillus methanolicus]